MSLLTNGSVSCTLISLHNAAANIMFCYAVALCPAVRCWHKHSLGARSSMATHQMHISKEVLRPLRSVYKVLAVVVGIPS